MFSDESFFDQHVLAAFSDSRGGSYPFRYPVKLIDHSHAEVHADEIGEDIEVDHHIGQLVGCLHQKLHPVYIATLKLLALIGVLAKLSDNGLQPLCWRPVRAVCLRMRQLPMLVLELR